MNNLYVISTNMNRENDVYEYLVYRKNKCPKTSLTSIKSILFIENYRGYVCIEAERAFDPVKLATNVVGVKDANVRTISLEQTVNIFKESRQIKIALDSTDQNILQVIEPRSLAKKIEQFFNDGVTMVRMNFFDSYKKRIGSLTLFSPESKVVQEIIKLLNNSNSDGEDAEEEVEADGEETEEEVEADGEDAEEEVEADGEETEEEVEADGEETEEEVDADGEVTEEEVETDGEETEEEVEADGEETEEEVEADGEETEEEIEADGEETENPKPNPIPNAQIARLEAEIQQWRQKYLESTQQLKRLQEKYQKCEQEHLQLNEKHTRVIQKSAKIEQNLRLIKSAFQALKNMDEL